MDNDIFSRLGRARRTREALREIRATPVGDRLQKYLLAHFFREHKRAAPTQEQKRAAYDTLLGRDRNRRLG